MFCSRKYFSIFIGRSDGLEIYSAVSIFYPLYVQNLETNPDTSKGSKLLRFPADVFGQILSFDSKVVSLRLFLILFKSFGIKEW
jgi:hypothetical protein